MKLLACSVKGFTHRSGRFRLKYALFREGTYWHERFPVTLHVANWAQSVKYNSDYALICNAPRIYQVGLQIHLHASEVSRVTAFTRCLMTCPRPDRAALLADRAAVAAL